MDGVVVCPLAHNARTPGAVAWAGGGAQPLALPASGAACGAGRGGRRDRDATLSVKLYL